MARITIDAARCTRCGTCVAICPADILVKGEEGMPPVTAHEMLCVRCGHCVAICPHEALAHSSFPEGRVKRIDKALLPSADQVMELLRARRSLRVFEARPVERELIEHVIEAARLAPSAHNTQSTEYIVVQDKAVLDEITALTVRYFAKLAGQLRNPLFWPILRTMAGGAYDSAMSMVPDLDMLVSEAEQGRDHILRGALCVIVLHARKSVHFPDANAVLALSNATLAAEALGLGSFQLGYVVGASQRDASIGRLLNLPRRHAIYTTMALGHPRLRFEKWIERRPARIKWM